MNAGASAPERDIEEAGPEHDASIRRLASENGLSVDPEASRRDPNQRLLVAVGRTQGVLGFVSARAILDEMEVLDLCVGHAHRRQGIGAALLSSLFDGARRGGIVDVFLEVRATNEAAQALYGKLGFSKVGVRARYYANGEDAALFRCCLTPTE